MAQRLPAIRRTRSGLSSVCAGVSRDRVRARGAETDGSSSCRSEHKGPERSLQSVVPVLNIGRSGAGVQRRLGSPSSSSRAVFLLPLQSALLPSCRIPSCAPAPPLRLCRVSVTPSHLSLRASVTSRPSPFQNKLSEAAGAKSPVRQSPLVGLCHEILLSRPPTQSDVTAPQSVCGL